MNSEKVKKIKKALENCQKNNCLDCPYFIDEKRCRANDLLLDTITLINELESENERLSKENFVLYRDRFTKKELNDISACRVKKATVELKDRIAELEKENDELKVDLKNSIDMQKEMLDGFQTATKEVEENLAREIPNLLKQFAKRLKEKLGSIDLIRGWVVKMFIDETLKEFLQT